MTLHILFLDNDTILRLKGLKDDKGAFINVAAVTLTIFDLKNVEVSGISWPVGMPFIVGSNGDYEFQIDDALPNFILNREYKAKIVATIGADVSTYWKYFTARERALGAS